MAKQRVMIVGGGLAGLSAAMKLAELGIDVDLMSLTPVKRSHSVCAQGGINSVNDLTRQQGDSEWLHFDDTVYGGDFLQHQPPVKEMTDWGPQDHRPDGPPGRALQSHARGLSRSAPLRRHAVQADGLCRRDDRPAVALRARRAGAPLGESTARSRSTSSGTFWARSSTTTASAAACVGQDLVTMEIRAFPADAVVIASGGCGLIYGRSTMSMVCTGSAASRTLSGRRQVRQRRVHPGPSDGHSRRRQAAADERNRPRRRGPRVGAAQAARSARPAERFPRAERYYFLEERYPKYGNLVPRDIATREIFNVCTQRGPERREGPAVRLSRPDAHPARRRSTASWAASWKSTRSSRASIRATCR